MKRSALFLRMKRDICKKCQITSEPYFETERSSETCFNCNGETIQAEVIKEIPAKWKTVIETIQPDLVKYIIG